MSSDPDQNITKLSRSKATPRLKELLWSERRGELMHAPSLRASSKWWGLTKQEWLLFGYVAGGAFALGLAALQLYG